LNFKSGAQNPLKKTGRNRKAKRVGIKLNSNKMNKSHATLFFTRMMGESDGEWTKEEIETGLLLGNLSSALEEAPDWAEKIISFELHETSAIDILNNESKEVQMQCLITVLSTAISDGELADKEKEVLVRIMSKLNKGITVQELLEAHKAHLKSLRK